MRKAKDRSISSYNTDLDKITWKEYQDGGVSTSKQQEYGINNTIHFILGNRSNISNAGLPTIDNIIGCKGCGCHMTKGEKCLKLTLSEGDSLISHVYFCSDCTR